MKENSIETFSHKKVAFHVVKKPPVDFIGQISTMKVTIIGSNIFNFVSDFFKYSFKCLKDLFNKITKNKSIKKRPIIPASLKISK